MQDADLQKRAALHAERSLPAESQMQMTFVQIRQKPHPFRLCRKRASG
jgi:hypothetical protein